MRMLDIAECNTAYSELAIDGDVRPGLGSKHEEAHAVTLASPPWWPRKGSPRQFRAEKWFWAATIPPTVAWDIVSPSSWSRWGVQYVAWLSIYALVKGAGAQEQAAEAKETAGNHDSERCWHDGGR